VWEFVPSFEFTIKTDNISAGSTADNQFKLPLINNGAIDFIIDWGDGSTDNITVWNQAETTHTYSSSGTYTITITGQIEGFRFANAGDKQKITNISNWGDLVIINDRSFDNCINLTFVGASGAPSITASSVNSMFRNCDALTTEDFSGWDFSSSSDLSELFSGCALFNGNVDNMVHSGVTNLRRTLLSCPQFNQDLDTWDVSGVTNWFESFRNCTSFNGDVSGWTFAVSGFNGTFNACTTFTGIGTDTWDVTNCTGFLQLFSNTQFNVDISGWNVTNANTYQGMFTNTPFNQDISGWNASPTNMQQTFQSCSAFDQDISGWDVSGCTNFYRTFNSATSFNQDLSSWNTGSVTTMLEMFRGANSFDQDIGGWDISSLTTATGMFIGVTLSTANYDSLLVGWEGGAHNNGVNFHGGNSTYTTGSAADTARGVLTGTDGWTITDGGPV
jgi:surface protein